MKNIKKMIEFIGEYATYGMTLQNYEINKEWIFGQQIRKTTEWTVAIRMEKDLFSKVEEFKDTIMECALQKAVDFIKEKFNVEFSCEETEVDSFGEELKIFADDMPCGISLYNTIFPPSGHKKIDSWVIYVNFGENHIPKQEVYQYTKLDMLLNKAKEETKIILNNKIF